MIIAFFKDNDYCFLKILHNFYNSFITAQAVHIITRKPCISSPLAVHKNPRNNLRGFVRVLKLNYLGLVPPEPEPEL